jgi:hypothetical protein
LVYLNFKGNPWGKKEWKGAWSNKWPHWPEHIKAQLAQVDSSKSSQGCFWMSFEDMVKYFYDITICKVRTNGWFESRQSSYFYDFSSGAQVYLLNIYEPGEYEFEIELFATGRKYTDFDRNADPEIDLCLVLCKIDNLNKSGSNTSLECIAFVHEIEYFISISKKLKAGNYTLFAASFRAISNLINETENYSNPNFYTYNLIIHGQCNFILNQTILTSNKTSDIFHSVALKENKIKYELENNVRTLTMSSNSIHFVIIENLSPHLLVKLNLDLTHSKNLENTRNSNVIEDYIAPLTRQLCMYLTPKDYRKGFVINYRLEYQVARDFVTNKVAHNNPRVPVFYSGLHCARSLKPMN